MLLPIPQVIPQVIPKSYHLEVAANLKGLAEEVGLDGSLVPWRYHLLGVGWFRAELEIAVLLAGTSGVDTNVVTGGKEVHVADVTLTSRVSLCPATVSGTLGKKV